LTASQPDRGLGSRVVPPVGADDHVGGQGALVVEYSDLECPYCAKTNALLCELPVRRVFRHFPVVSKHPRARMLAHALEAAAIQGAFWEMHGSLFADQGHLDDPHLWERCERLGLDLDAFERDRRSDGVAARVDRDFRSGVRAGVMTTPTLFHEGRAYPGVPDAGLLSRLGG
jgi:protein-disulfide isomerase